MYDGLAMTVCRIRALALHTVPRHSISWSAGIREGKLASLFNKEYTQAFFLDLKWCWVKTTLRCMWTFFRENGGCMVSKQGLSWNHKKQQMAEKVWKTYRTIMLVRWVYSPSEGRQNVFEWRVTNKTRFWVGRRKVENRDRQSKKERTEYMWKYK